MYFPKFWAKGSYNHQVCWHWSDISVGVALDLANKNAKRLSNLFTRETRPLKDQYWYANRPLREPVLDEITNERGEVIGLITRNRYGTKVLNTEKVLFVDVDVTEPRREGALAGFIGALFGKKVTPIEATTDNVILTKAQSWCGDNSESSWRIYKTKAGFRLIATHETIAPDSELATKAFEHFDADPLYRKLCLAQKSFRARLTPKPWRCGMDTPTNSWPFADAQEESKFLDWERAYAQRQQPFATCKFLHTVGSGEMAHDVAPLIALHDELCRVGDDLPLA